MVKTGLEFAVTDYMSGFQYRSSYTEAGGDQQQPRLQFFPTAEGYVEWLESHPRYVYNYTDHLGNVRLSYAYDENVNMLRIIEENNYYPFGLKHQNYNNTRLHFEVIEDEVILHQVPFSVGDGKYNYKYNGKELQEELGLNVTAMDYRQYDSSLGRFNSVDALSELEPDKSPYSYSRNSPLFYSDPTGLCPECEAYYESIGAEPYGGETFTSAGGELYYMDEISGLWTRDGGNLQEVEVYLEKGKSFDGIDGNNDDRAGVDQRDDVDNGQSKSTEVSGFNAAGLITGGIGSISETLGNVWNLSNKPSQNKVAYDIQKLLKQNFNTSVKTSTIKSVIPSSLAKASNGLAVVGGAITVLDGLKNGFKPHHAADIGIQATIYTVSASIPIAGWIVGGSYFVADLCFQAKYGMSITEYYLD